MVQKKVDLSPELVAIAIESFNREGGKRAASPFLWTIAEPQMKAALTAALPLLEKQDVQHRWFYCELCERLDVCCGKCGNNCCNGGYGTVDGKECDACPSAYAYAEKAYENGLSNAVEALEKQMAEKVLRELCNADSKWLSEAYGYSDFSLPIECGGGSCEGCINELRGALLHVLKCYATEHSINFTKETL